jgi:hypothetical protein
MKFKLDFKRMFGRVTDALFALGLTDPNAFHGAVRPILQGHAEGDIGKAQELALEGLQQHLHVIKQHSDGFLKQLSDDLSLESVMVPVAGRLTTPVGTGCGMDPNADALEVFSLLFGFQLPGPVTVQPHERDARPFQDDARRADLFVPSTLASRGLDYFLENLRRYRAGGGEGIVVAGIVGVPDGPGGLDQAHQEMRCLLEALIAEVDGFVWTPYAASCEALMSQAEFRRTAERMTDIAAGKLKLVEMPACEAVAQDAWLGLVEAFLSGGGDGVVAVGGLEVPRSRLPDPDRWPFDTALLCGASLADYRQRAIEEVRRRHATAFLAACGGFHSRDEAFRACEYANVIVENEAFTRYGPGIARRLLNKLVLRLNHLQRKGVIESNRLADYQQRRWFPREE